MSVRDIPIALADKLAISVGSYAASFDEVRMDDIARASGIPRATLYYYFAGKEEVLGFLLSSMLTDLRLNVAAAAETVGGTEARLAAVMRAQLSHLDANPTISQMLLANLGKAGKLPEIAAGINEGFLSPVRRILAEGIRDGSVLDLDVEVVASALFGAVTIVGFQALLGRGGIDVDGVSRSLFSVFWSGISPPNSPTAGRRNR